MWRQWPAVADILTGKSWRNQRRPSELNGWCTSLYDWCKGCCTRKFLQKPEKRSRKTARQLRFANESRNGCLMLDSPHQVLCNEPCFEWECAADYFLARPIYSGFLSLRRKRTGLRERRQSIRGSKTPSEDLFGFSRNTDKMERLKHKCKSLRTSRRPSPFGLQAGQKLLRYWCETRFFSSLSKRERAIP